MEPVLSPYEILDSSKKQIFRDILGKRSFENKLWSWKCNEHTQYTII